MGGGAGEAQAEQMLMAEFVKYKTKVEIYLSNSLYKQ